MSINVEMDAVEIRIIKWMTGLRRRDKTRYEDIGGSVNVECLSEAEIRGNHVTYGRLERRDEDYIGSE